MPIRRRRRRRPPRIGSGTRAPNGKNRRPIGLYHPRTTYRGTRERGIRSMRVTPFRPSSPFRACKLRYRRRSCTARRRSLPRCHQLPQPRTPIRAILRSGHFHDRALAGLLDTVMIRFAFRTERSQLNTTTKPAEPFGAFPHARACRRPKRMATSQPRWSRRQTSGVVASNGAFRRFAAALKAGCMDLCVYTPPVHFAQQIPILVPLRRTVLAMKHHLPVARRSGDTHVSVGAKPDTDRDILIAFWQRPATAVRVCVWSVHIARPPVGSRTCATAVPNFEGLNMPPPYLPLRCPSRG